MGTVSLTLVHIAHVVQKLADLAKLRENNCEQPTKKTRHSGQCTNLAKNFAVGSINNFVTSDLGELGKVGLPLLERKLGLIVKVQPLKRPSQV